MRTHFELSFFLCLKTNKLYGISLNYNICTAYDLDYYEELKNYYFETNEYSKEFQGSMLGRYLINKILKLSKGRFQTFNASKVGTFFHSYISILYS